MLTSYFINDLFDFASTQNINDKILSCINGSLTSFSEKVTLISRNGQRGIGVLTISVYEKQPEHTLLMGIVSSNTSAVHENEAYVSEILRVLKKENIVVSEAMGKKLTDIFKVHNVKLKSQVDSIFSDRENQVLRLSMEGLPIKNIADKLSISDRTVEKYRSSMMEKTNSNNMIEVIIYALRNNLVEI